MSNSQVVSNLRSTTIGIATLSPLLACCMLLTSHLNLSPGVVSHLDSGLSRACLAGVGIVQLSFIVSRWTAESARPASVSQILRLGFLGLIFTSILMFSAPAAAAGMELSAYLRAQTSISGLLIGTVSLLLLVVLQPHDATDSATNGAFLAR